ncbi:unnamed protein product [Closterium sp. Yama58-4]|nr:unnamed protein product [Closterium sp. Yama58-4]
MAERDSPRGPPGAHSNDGPPLLDATTEEKSPFTHPPQPLSAPGFPASPNLPAAFPAASDLPAFPGGSSLSYGRSDSPLPACLAPRFTQTKSRDDVAADCAMPHAFKQSLDDLCCLNLIGSRNATLEAPRSTNRAAQNKIFDDFSCLGLGLDDESDGLFRSAPQSRSVSPPPAFPPPLAAPPPLCPERAAPDSAPGAQVSAFSAALAAATGAAAKSSSAAFAADQLPQHPRSAFPPSPANVPAVPLPSSRPPSSSSPHPSCPLSRESGRAFERQHILGVREEPRLREQDFGNFQVQERMRQIKDMRQRFGRFFYRFPEGESSADVYDRVTGGPACTHSEGSGRQEGSRHLGISGVAVFLRPPGDPLEITPCSACSNEHEGSLLQQHEGSPRELRGGCPSSTTWRPPRDHPLLLCPLQVKQQWQQQEEQLFEPTHSSLCYCVLSSLSPSPSPSPSPSLQTSMRA